MRSIFRRLLGGSLILLITFNIFNFLNLLFNVAMARSLTIEDYGVLTILMNLIIIFAVFSESIQTVLSRYSTQNSDKGKLKSLILKTFNKSKITSIKFYAIYAIAAIFLSTLLEINYFLLLFTGLGIFLAFFVPITRGVLQGRERFIGFGTNMVLEGGLKLLISVALVITGFRVFGAVLGILIGSTIALLFSFINLKDILVSKSSNLSTPRIYNYTKPVFIVNLAVVLFVSIDLIIARILFSPSFVGEYALFSTIAKIIFVGTQPISKAMFPLSTRSSQKKRSRNILFLTLSILLIPVLLFLILIYIFPGEILNLYYGKDIISDLSILFNLSLAFSLFSFANLFMFYRLSKGELRNYSIIPILIAVQAIILFFSDSSLISFSYGMISSAIIFLLGVLMFLSNEETRNSSSST